MRTLGKTWILNKVFNRDTDALKVELGNDENGPLLTSENPASVVLRGNDGSILELLDSNGNLKTGALDSDVDSISSVPPFMVASKTQTDIVANVITLTEEVDGVEIINDGNIDITMTINTIAVVIKPKEVQEHYFKVPFDTITFSANPVFRLFAKQKPVVV